ncbi:MAG: TIGR00730 family Rossman fold protein [Desulfovibrionaceae bacterium]
MHSVCVFLGSNPGTLPAYTQAARRLGAVLAARGLTLVYGGSSVGLMGELADAVLGAGGRAVGVIPQRLVDHEIAHTGLTESHVVRTMHERKARMAELSDAFVALPGGLGTLDEFFEVLTWNQLGLHAKPCGLLDVGGFYELLARFLDTATAHGFIPGYHRDMILRDDTPEGLLAQFETYAPPPAKKWITRRMQP